ncbi:Crp/Fnr family transcriptional regulator [Rhodophyticola sp.]|jgi:CRP-like cAMP-binding protein|uniref:Crp/Fnr family transcriptional regulator n=1 Tax=Rhodophyticola sp. TaxID=2680032 RepID=UPI003D2E155E
MTGRRLLTYGLPLLAGLKDDDLAGIPLNFKEKNLDPWELLFNHEDSSRDVYFLLSGALLAVYWTKEGREVIFSRFATGSYLGELSALDGGHRSLAVVARSPAKVLILPQAAFLDLFDKVPVLRTRIARDLVARIRALTARNLELTTFSVEQRVASFLIGLAMERGRLEIGGILDDAPTHAEIAASIGANREMVSRTMTKLGRRGLLKSSRQRIELLNPGALSEVV